MAASVPGVTGGGGGGGVLATAGDVVFTGDGGGNFVAFDATNGKPLWHARIGSISNAPQTYMVDGRQHVLVAVGDTLYASRWTDGSGPLSSETLDPDALRHG